MEDDELPYSLKQSLIRKKNYTRRVIIIGQDQGQFIYCFFNDRCSSRHKQSFFIQLKEFFWERIALFRLRQLVQSSKQGNNTYQTLKLFIHSTLFLKRCQYKQCQKSRSVLGRGFLQTQATNEIIIYVLHKLL